MLTINSVTMQFGGRYLFDNVSVGDRDRLTFIGKENEIESGLGDFGVRKYDGGRFLSY